MIRNGDVELKAREEEIRFLKMEVTMKYFKSFVVRFDVSPFTCSFS